MYEFLGKEKPIISLAQAKFLEEFKDGGKISSFEDKFKILARAQGAKITETYGFSLNSEEEYKNFIAAVLLGEWQLNLFRINVTQDLGIENFLACDRDEDGNIIINEGGKIDWETVDFEDSTLFTEEEINTFVPSKYRYADNILRDEDARKMWAKTERFVTDNNEDGSQIVEDETNELIEEAEEQSTSDSNTNYTEQSIKMVKGFFNSKAN